jgi:trigger factor
VKPEVTLGVYKGIEVAAPSVDVTEEEISKEIDVLRERQAELVIKEEASSLGDTVVIDFEGFLEDVPFEGGKGTNYSLELGSKSFIPGFEDQLVGHTPGANVQVHVTFPEEYHAPDLAGKAVRFDVTIHEIKTKVLPVVDDEFAKDADDQVSSLAELKEKIQKRLKDRKEHDAKHSIEDHVIETAASNTTVEIPEVMIQSEIRRMLREFDQRLQSQGMNLERYYQFSGQSEDALKEQMYPDAQKRVRANLMLAQVIQAESITVSEDEVKAEVEKMATVYQMTVTDIEKALGSLDGIRQELLIRKAIQLLVAESVKK